MCRTNIKFPMLPPSNIQQKKNIGQVLGCISVGNSIRMGTYPTYAIANWEKVNPSFAKDDMQDTLCLTLPPIQDPAAYHHSIKK